MAALKAELSAQAQAPVGRNLSARNVAKGEAGHMKHGWQARGRLPGPRVGAGKGFEEEKSASGF